jgi:hypothetical protein
MVNVINGQMLRLPWAPPFWLRQLIEAIPLAVKLRWKFSFIFSRFLPHKKFKGGNYFIFRRIVSGKFPIAFAMASYIP